MPSTFVVFPIKTAFGSDFNFSDSLWSPDTQVVDEQITALVVEQICSQVLEVPPDVIKEPMQQYKLPTADCCDGALSQQIEILIGADNHWEFVTRHKPTLPVYQGVQAVEATLGWTLQGPCSLPNVVRTARCHTVTVLHLKNDRYSVASPWKPVVSMQDNKYIAAQRLSQVTRRLSKSQRLMARYDTAIREYLASGVAEKVTQEMDRAQNTAHIYNTPHHAVIRVDRITTKMRMVFDASSHEPGTSSLNDKLNAGLNLNPDIMPLLMNFRLYPVALISDVQETLLQITIHEDDRDALRLLWYRTTPVDGMTRVTFGTAPSTFLLDTTLQHHIQLYASEHPR
ncbi:uncharacterized protein LOC135389237 [Ornithodoros turicata]|uniref:uncharacterized protein LOC135389237 n=1 Tax=Ornithodoros turicata TaxID=34597 RepID=UPI003139FDF7